MGAEEVRRRDANFDGALWRVELLLMDPEGLNDWVPELEVDIVASRESGEPVLHLLRLESLV